MKVNECFFMYESVFFSELCSDFFSELCSDFFSELCSDFFPELCSDLFQLPFSPVCKHISLLVLAFQLQFSPSVPASISIFTFCVQLPFSPSVFSFHFHLLYVFYTVSVRIFYCPVSVCFCFE